MIKEINKNTLKDALTLVNHVFEKYVAVGYSQQGQDTFHKYLENKYEEVSADLLSGKKKMWGYFIDDKIVGVISVRDISHISLLFVDENYHRKGIAKEMFAFLLSYLQDNFPEEKTVTVNSSPYAVQVYKKLGFVQTGNQIEKDGIIFVPLKYSI